MGTDATDRNPVATARPRDAPRPGGALRRHTPKVGAQCGNPARWDLRGGPPAKAVPTATISRIRPRRPLGTQDTSRTDPGQARSLNVKHHKIRGRAELADR